MKYYRFLTGDDDSKFCHKVTEALSNGWELYGSPQLSFDNKLKKFKCGQAVIKNSPIIRSKEHINESTGI